MGAMFAFLRWLNALVCRIGGAAGVFVGAAVFSAWRQDPAAVEAAFGNEDQAMLAMVLLPALSLVLMVPAFTRAVFLGGVDWRMFRGVVQLAVLAAVMIIASLALPAIMPPQSYAENEATLTLVAELLLGAMALSWLGRETGVRPDAAPQDWDRTQSPRYLREMRKARTPRG